MAGLGESPALENTGQGRSFMVRVHVTGSEAMFPLVCLLVMLGDERQGFYECSFTECLLLWSSVQLNRAYQHSCLHIDNTLSKVF